LATNSRRSEQLQDLSIDAQRSDHCTDVRAVENLTSKALPAATSDRDHLILVERFRQVVQFEIGRIPSRFIPARDQSNRKLLAVRPYQRPVFGFHASLSTQWLVWEQANARFAPVMVGGGGLSKPRRAGD
jgi:hypothetical protein